MKILEKFGLWLLRKQGNVRHMGQGNSILLKDRFGEEARINPPPPGPEAWEAGCCCPGIDPEQVKQHRTDRYSVQCPLHWAPRHYAVYIRLK